MNEIVEKNIENKIYVIRGVQVMLDSDLARIYKCKNGTKSINLAVKRHANRFPERFMFKLTFDECMNISRFQFETLEEGKGHNIKYLPYAFTEQGVAMLSAVLRTPVADEVSVRIMDAFVKMRHCIIENQNYLPNRVLLLEEKVDNNTKKINEIFDKFETIKKNQILFEGEVYDAYSLLMDILSISSKEIIIIDNYADVNSLSNEDICGIINRYGKHGPWYEFLNGEHEIIKTPAITGKSAILLYEWTRCKIPQLFKYNTETLIKSGFNPDYSKDGVAARQEYTRLIEEKQIEKAKGLIREYRG